MAKNWIIIGGIFLSCFFTSSAYAIDQTEIIYGQQKLKIIDGKAQVTIVGSSTTNIGTITAFEQTIWTTSPPIKAYDFTLNIAPLATSSTLFTIGTPIAGYRAYVEYITLIRDEPKLMDYISLQLIDTITNKLLIGGEIVPASTLGLIMPPLPLLVTDLNLLLTNKSLNDTQKIRVSIVVSVRKVTDYIFSQPY